MRDVEPVDALLRVFNNLDSLEKQIITERERLQQDAEDKVFDIVTSVNETEDGLSRLLVSFSTLLEVF